MDSCYHCKVEGPELYFIDDRYTCALCLCETYTKLRSDLASAQRVVEAAKAFLRYYRQHSYRAKLSYAHAGSNIESMLEGKQPVPMEAR